MIQISSFSLLKLEIGPGVTPGRGQINSVSNQNAPILSCSGKEVIDFSSIRKGFKEKMKNLGRKIRFRSLLHPDCLSKLGQKI